MTTEPKPAPRRRYLLAGVAAAAVVAGGAGVGIANAEPSVPAGQAAAPSTTTTSPSPDTASTAPKPGDGSRRPSRGPHLNGTVTSVTGGTITIKDRDGFTRVIETSTADTTFSDGLTMPIAAGTKIEASGTVNADGVRLDATAVRTWSDIGRGRPGRHGGPGGRGPGDGHGRPAGPPETGQPTSPDGTGTPTTPSTTPSTG